MISFLKTQPEITKQGMTTIELVVVFGIFAALATSVLFSYREFSTNIKLQNLAQDIALQIRLAQTRAVSGSYPELEPLQVAPDPNWAPSYGLYFSKDEGLNDRFALFFDKNTAAVSNPEYFNLGNKQILMGDVDCDVTDINSECLDVIQITSGEVIDSICLDEFSYGTCSSVDDVHIVFARPLNRAYISYGEAGDNEQPIFFSDASIYLRSPGGNLAVVRVTATGQIIVE